MRTYPLTADKYTPKDLEDIIYQEINDLESLDRDPVIQKNREKHIANCQLRKNILIKPGLIDYISVEWSQIGKGLDSKINASEEELQELTSILKTVSAEQYENVLELILQKTNHLKQLLSEKKVNDQIRFLMETES